MEYQKIANLLNDVSNKPSKFRTGNRVKINNESSGTYKHRKKTLCSGCNLMNTR